MASLPVWSTDFSVGHPQLDQQHMTLLSLGRQFMAAVTDPLLTDQFLIDSLNDLLVLSKVHDAKEEILLAQANYPDLAAHQQQHRQERCRLEALIVRMSRGGVERAACAEEVHGWLVHLFTEADEPIRTFLRQQKVPGPAVHRQ